LKFNELEKDIHSSNEIELGLTDGIKIWQKIKNRDSFISTNILFKITFRKSNNIILSDKLEFI